jgi:hypothetical protein
MGSSIDDFKEIFLQTPPDGRAEVNVVSTQPSPATAEDQNAAQPTDKDQQVSGSVNLRNIMKHYNAHPVALDILMTQKYGVDWLLWEPETIELRVPQDFRTNISFVNLSKLQAMRTMHLVDSFWLRWEVFCWCTMALNGVPPDFEVMQVPTVAQCMVAVDIANRVRDDVDWSTEVKTYIAMVHRHDEILVPQAPLDFVKVDTDGLPIDVPNILKRWQDVRTSEKPPIGDTAEDEQLRRMLDVHKILEDSRANLRQQLKEILYA